MSIHLPLPSGLERYRNGEPAVCVRLDAGLGNDAAVRPLLPDRERLVGVEAGAGERHLAANCSRLRGAAGRRIRGYRPCR